MPTRDVTGDALIDTVEQAIRELLDNDSAPVTFIPFNYSSNAAERRALVKSGAAYLFGFTVSNSNAAARFIQVFDTAALPNDGTVPDICVSCSAVGDKEMLWWPPRRCDQGIVLCASTTQNTLTLAAAEFLFDVQYV